MSPEFPVPREHSWNQMFILQLILGSEGAQTQLPHLQPVHGVQAVAQHWGKASSCLEPGQE